jgi:hypothetical protein
MAFVGRPKKIVVLGMMSRWPVAGVAWVTVQYLEGLRRLGHEVYYVEAHGCTQTKFMRSPEDDGVSRAADYIASVMRRFDFGRQWAYHDVHMSGGCFGMTREQLDELYRSATMLINLHGATEPLPEHAATGRLVYLETDPVEVQIALGQGSSTVTEFLDAHCAYFTWGLNYGNPDCRLPTSPRYPFRHSPPVVVADFWQPNEVGPADTFTTVGNWRQDYKQVVLDGEVFHWSKHLEFLKFIDLPRRTRQRFELALSPASLNTAEADLLATHGWGVRDGLGVSSDLDTYHRYVSGSRGEFTVAKDQNVRLRSGWFSERSAQYLAAGRPVITQDTGFGSALPTGQGLFPFRTMEEILVAMEAVNADYAKHCQAAAALAREHFDADVVLRRLIKEVGL